MGHPLTALLVTGIHAVGVSVTAPPQGDAQAIQPALELIGMAASGRSGGWKTRGCIRRERPSGLARMPSGGGLERPVSLLTAWEPWETDPSRVSDVTPSGTPVIILSNAPFSTLRMETG